MTTIFLNDHEILFAEGTFDSGMYLLERTESLNTDFNINELINEPSFQVHTEEIIKSKLEEHGMTTEEVVILFPGNLTHHKHFVPDATGNSPVSVSETIETELQLSFESLFSSEKDSFYHLPNLFSHSTESDLALFFPKPALHFTSRLIKTAGWTSVNVLPEPLSLHNFYDTFPGKPENFIAFHAYGDNHLGVFLYVQNSLSKMFTIPVNSSDTYSDVVAHFMSNLIGFNYPDTEFHASIVHKDGNLVNNLSEHLSNFNISLIDSKELVSMVQSPIEDPIRLIKFVSLLGTFVK